MLLLRAISSDTLMHRARPCIGHLDVHSPLGQIRHLRNNKPDKGIPAGKAQRASWFLPANHARSKDVRTAAKGNRIAKTTFHHPQKPAGASTRREPTSSDDTRPQLH